MVERPHVIEISFLVEVVQIYDHVSVDYLVVLQDLYLDLFLLIRLYPRERLGAVGLDAEVIFFHLVSSVLLFSQEGERGFVVNDVLDVSSRDLIYHNAGMIPLPLYLHLKKYPFGVNVDGRATQLKLFLGFDALFLERIDVQKPDRIHIEGP